MGKNRRSSDDDSEFEDISPSKRQRGPPKTTPPLYKAEVIATAHSASVRVSSSTVDLDEGVLIRMKKCLTRANHPETPEAEAKAALHIASKLMRTYNVSQAEVLAHEAPEDQRKYAGSSEVAIKRRDGNREKKVNHNNYIDTLCHAMRTFFACKSYTTSGRTSFKIKFYGIAENTVAAASAFEMVYNLMVEWARPYKGMSGKNSYCYGISDELWVTAEKEKREEEERAKKADEDANAARLRQEQADEQARLDRLRGLHVSVEDEHEAMLVDKTAVTPERLRTPEPQVSSALQDIRDMYPSSPESSASDEYEYEEWNGFSDDDGDDEPNESGIDYCAADFDDDDEDDEEYYMPDNDVDDEIDLLAAAMKRSFSPEPKTPPPFRSNDRGAATDARSDTRRDSVEPQAGTTDDDPRWKSHMQLIQSRETTEKIAEDYLTDQGIKLHKGRKRSGVKDWAAFKQGQKDSKKIDVRRKNIMAHSKDEQEQAGSLLMALD